MRFGTWLGAVVCLGLLHWPYGIWLLRRVRTPTDQFYGALILLVTLILLYLDRRVLREISGPGDGRGLALVAVGLAMALAGWIWHPGLMGLSWPLGLVGLCWIWWGPALARQVAFPLGLLIFLLPLAINRDADINATLQLISAVIATFLLHGVGFAALREGTWITLPGYKVVVNETCSGVNTLLAFLLLGALIAFLAPLTLGRRLMVFTITLASALLVNAVRVAVIALLGHYYGHEVAQGPMHQISAYILYAPVYLGLYLLARGLGGRD